MAERVKCDMAVFTGVHSGEALIKQLLAGANAVQVISCLYKNGVGYIESLLNYLEVWIHNKGFKQVSDFRGRMNQMKSLDPSLPERTQFMKYFGGKSL